MNESNQIYLKQDCFLHVGPIEPRCLHLLVVDCREQRLLCLVEPHEMLGHHFDVISILTLIPAAKLISWWLLLTVLYQHWKTIKTLQSPRAGNPIKPSNTTYQHRKVHHHIWTQSSKAGVTWSSPVTGEVKVNHTLMRLFTASNCLHSTLTNRSTFALTGCFHARKKSL